MRDEQILALMGNPYPRMQGTSQRIRRVLREGQPIGAFKRVWEILDMSDEAVAALLGVTRRTLERRVREQHRFNAVEADRAFRLVHIFDLARQTLGDDERARGWLLEPHPALGGLAPVEAMANSYDAERIEELLLQIEHGIFH